MSFFLLSAVYILDKNHLLFENIRQTELFCLLISILNAKKIREFIVSSFVYLCIYEFFTANYCVKYRRVHIQSHIAPTEYQILLRNTNRSLN